MTFPNTTFGTCPVCGGKGADDENASGADVAARDTEGNGEKLVLFRGEYICKLCKQNTLNNEKTERDVQGQLAEDEWRNRAGFKSTIT